ncbi:YdhR family protein [Pseudorhodoferax soli]|uniref:Putative monooxygenase ydhR n=1 Tax=Pseudorhodoferax soli TaxID=545864 RepID=A0A368XIV1_9BURK|nr:YdhR family protein [Pseudorhodoferax soli]RCW67960.1 putative monooxygenase ydhR [Pseudorhodoferax soli]
MIVATVTFKLTKSWTIAEAAAVFNSTAPKYLGKPGLIRKYYFVSESGDRAGGIYLWETKADAEKCYAGEWRAIVAEKYGAEPDIQYAEVPVSVDNVLNIIQNG